MNIDLIDAQSDQVVTGSLVDPVPSETLEDVGASWVKIRETEAMRVAKSGKSPPEHWHWDWRKKVDRADLLAFRCVGVQCEDEVQGLMMLTLGMRNTLLEPDQKKPLVYVEYVESAPWNLREFGTEPRYRGVGSVLIDVAVCISIDEGFHGRLGLHSLPQAEPFYERIGMTRVGPDHTHEGLCYYEFTRVSAATFRDPKELL